MPGLVEGHSHVAEGVQWRFVYCGYFDRTDPDGTIWPGLTSIEAVIARLTAGNAEIADPERPLTGWALDPIYFDNRRMTRQDLDRVSTSRPIGIMHASGHIMNVNYQGAGIGRHASCRHQSSGRPDSATTACRPAK